MMTEENKSFGKKPVRRSKAEENEPARVYRPRTMRWAPKASEEPDANRVSEANREETAKPARIPSSEGYGNSEERPRRRSSDSSDRKRFDGDNSSGRRKRSEFDGGERKTKSEPEAFNYTESKKSTYNPDDYVEEWERKPRPSRERGNDGFRAKEGFKPKRETPMRPLGRPGSNEAGERRYSRPKPEGSGFGEERKGKYTGESDRKPFRKSGDRSERFPKSTDKGYSSERRGRRDEGETKTRPYGDRDSKSSNRGYSPEPRGRRNETGGNSRSCGDRPFRGKFENERNTEKQRERKYPKREDETGKHRDVGFRKAKGSLYNAPQIEAELKTDSDGLIRLNKYISNSGLCSRREADEYIANGMITVNGVVVNQLGAKIKPTDEVQFKGNKLDPEKKIYILLNKPKDYVTTVEDPNAKFTVMDLIEGACDQRVYPVGRLDRNSTGLLLLTNDGELTTRLTHPSFQKKKVYEVGLDRNLTPADMEALTKGVTLDDGEVAYADAVAYIDESDKSEIGIEIHTGQNRVVRRMFESLGYKVSKLDRVYYAGLTKKNLPRGKWRFLDENEIRMLKMNRFE